MLPPSGIVRARDEIPEGGFRMAGTTKTKRKTLYSVHPGVEMVQKWIAELPEKTGRSLEEWIDHIRRKGPPTQKAKRDWLKHEYGFGSNTCWWLAERADPEASM